jgi:cell division septation protein DedD
MSDDKTRDDDEDLMSDFKDLFPEDDDTAETSTDDAASGDAGEALDELDAFLDDFEKGFTPTEETADSTAGAGDAVLAAEEEESIVGADEGGDALQQTGEPDSSPESDEAVAQGATAELELGRDELDLAMSEATTDEVFDDNWGESGEGEDVGRESVETAAVAAEPEQEAVMEETQVNEESVAELAAPSTSVPATPTVAQSATAPAMGRAMQWSVISIMLVALALSATAAWLAFSTASELDRLQRSVQAIQQKELGMVQRDTPALSSMRTELHTLAARVNELAAVIEGPMSHLRQSNEDTLADIEKRLVELEAAAGPQTAKAVTSKPAARQKATSRPAAGTSGAGWVINLVSLSSEKDADAELKHLRSLGVRAEKSRAEKDGKVWYRLRVPGFTSYEGAKAYIDTIEKKTGVKNAWVAKN